MTPRLFHAFSAAVQVVKTICIIMFGVQCYGAWLKAVLVSRSHIMGLKGLEFLTPASRSFICYPRSSKPIMAPRIGWKPKAIIVTFTHSYNKNLFAFPSGSILPPCIAHASVVCLVKRAQSWVLQTCIEMLLFLSTFMQMSASYFDLLSFYVHAQTSM